MSHFRGGSASAMARQIADGYVLLTALVLKRFTATELQQLKFEIDRKLRELRGEHVDLEDTQALQLRNRKIARLTSSLRVVDQTVTERRRGRA